MDHYQEWLRAAAELRDSEFYPLLLQVRARLLDRLPADQDALRRVEALIRLLEGADCAFPSVTPGPRPAPS